MTMSPKTLPKTSTFGYMTENKVTMSRDFFIFITATLREVQDKKHTYLSQ
jgi:hypothetical protein